MIFKLLRVLGNVPLAVRVVFMGLSKFKTKADQCDCYISVSSKGTGNLIKPEAPPGIPEWECCLFLVPLLKLDFRLTTPVRRR